MRLVLDTNALWHPPLVDAISEAKTRGLMDDGRLAVILPAIAYAERLRQLRAHARDLGRWREELDDSGVKIEAFGEREAHQLHEAAAEEALWRRHGRDFLIAAHAGVEGEVVTQDQGPAWRGVRTLTPPEAAAAIRDILSP